MAWQNVGNRGYLVLFFIFAMLEILMCAGIQYGWASIVVVFKLEHFFLSRCKNYQHLNLEELSRNISLRTSDTIPGCHEQDNILNLIFTMSVFVICFQFPAGVLLDKFGPRKTRVVAGLLFVLSCIGLGFVQIGYEMLLFPIFIGIAIGGGILLLTVLQVSNVIFRNARSMVLCILHGAFDSSSVFMLVFKLLWERGIMLKYITLVYGCLCFALTSLGTFVLVPPFNKLIEWSEEENKQIERKRQLTISQTFSKSMDGSVKINNQEYGSTQRSYRSSNGSISDVPAITVREDSIWKSIFSPLYLLEVLVLINIQLKLWYYVGALQDYLGKITNDDKDTVSYYINVFGYIQFGGLLVNPIIGFIYDKNKIGEEEDEFLNPAKRHLDGVKSSILPYFITIFLATLFCVLGLFQTIHVEIPSYILYTIVRGFLYANHGAYIGAAFPASQFGTLYGLGIFIGSVFGFLQYAFFNLTSYTYNGNPFYTNLILLILVMLTNFHPFYLLWYSRQKEKLISVEKQPLIKSATFI